MTALLKLKSTPWELWLPFLAIIALPFGRSVELFTLIMAVIGLSDLIKNKHDIRHSFGFKTFTAFFLCFWVPALLSLPDAFDLSRSSSSTFGILRFYFAGLFIINRISSDKHHQWLGIGIALTLVFWSLDAWLQLLSGTDMFGLAAYSSNRISGIFGEDAKLGLMIIPFLGVSIAALKEKWGITFSIITTLVIISAVLISGDRASWVSLFTALCLWLILFRPKNINFSQTHFIAAVVGLILMAGTVISTPQFQSTINRSIMVLSGDYKDINRASSSRLPIWLTALNMFSDNAINGVGVRSFRYAYPDYAQKNDPFVNFSIPREKQSGPMHTHQIILEFMTDTGLIGLIGYIIALWILFIIWRQIARSKQSAIATGYLISLMVILFPINTHMSFFSSNWAQVVWFLVALCVSALATTKQKEH